MRMIPSPASGLLELSLAALAVFALFASPVGATTGDCQSCAAVAKYRAQIKPDPKLELQQTAQITKAYETLSAFVLEAGSKPALRSTAHLTPALDLGAILLAADPQAYAGEVLFPLYRDHQAEFQTALSRLTETRRRSLLRAVQQFERELQSGNG